jgi:low temperature requirement protein LtrA
VALPKLPMLNSIAPWIDPPRLRVDDPEERHATWLELFFDLVFVAAVAQTASGLAHDPTLEGFLRYGATFLPVAWAWMGFAVYANRFDTDDAIFRITMAAGMLAVAALAVAAPHATTTEAQAFALCYVGVRSFLIGFTIGASLWFISAFVDSPERFVLWGAGFAAELATPFVTWGLLARGLSALHVQHIEERFGLFTIIVLGEAVLAVVTGIRAADFDLAASATAAATLAIAVSIWWIYFDLADTSVIHRGLRGFIYVYGHLLLSAGVAAFGVGAKLAIQGSGADGLAAGVRWALCGGIAAYLIALALFHAAVRTRLRDSIVLWRLGAAVALCLLAGLGGGLPPLAFVLIAAALAITQLAVEATCTRIDCTTPVPEFEVSLASIAEKEPAVSD